MQSSKRSFRSRFFYVIVVLFSSWTLLFLCACTSQDNTSENDLRNKAFGEKCSELIKTYGPPSTQSQISTEYATGLCLADLIDFNGDGKDELIVAYAASKQPGSYDVPPVEIEIWSFDGQDLQQVFQGNPSLWGTNGYFPFIDLYSRADGEGLAFLRQTCHGSSPVIYSYELLGYKDDGSFGDIVEPALSFEDFESILGESKYRAYLFDISSGELEPGILLDKVISDTKETLKDLNVDMSILKKEADQSEDQATEDDTITDAIYLDLDAVEKDMNENPARAKLNWEGKIVKYSSTITRITEDSVFLDTGKNYALCVSSLPLEEIAQLNKGDHVTVVGAYLSHVGIDGYSIVQDNVG